MKKSLILIFLLKSMENGMRSIFNEGAGIPEIITPTIALTVLGMLCFYAGIKLFKWQ